MTHTPDIKRSPCELVEGLAKIGSASGELSRLGIRDPHIRVVVPTAMAPALFKSANEHEKWEEFSRLRLSKGGICDAAIRGRPKRRPSSRPGSATTRLNMPEGLLS